MLHVTDVAPAAGIISITTPLIVPALTLSNVTLMIFGSSAAQVVHAVMSILAASVVVVGKVDSPKLVQPAPVVPETPATET